MRPKLNLRGELEQLFEKKFQYQKQSAWQLPGTEEPLFSEFYQYKALQDLKEQLNAVKSKLNDFGVKDWSTHTNKRDPAGEVSWRLKNETKAEFVTVAWCKFFECLHRYALVESPVLNTLHLCEAPGAFIASLNHYLYSTYQADEIKWRWRSTTLNPYYEGNPLGEMIIDDRFIFHTLNNWLFHADFTGNLINIANINHMVDRCAEDLPHGVDLITADGSIDCSAQPDCQEEIVSRVFMAEIIAALRILRAGGNFVIKMFTLFEACSVSILYMLNCVFGQVHIYKPATSKRGNSEVYVICLNYEKETPGLPHLLQIMQTTLDQCHDLMVMPLFGKSQIPSDFLLQHEIGCRMYMNLQCKAIENSIYAYESKDRTYSRYIHDLRGLVSAMYYNRYRVRPLADELCIVKKQQISKTLGFWLSVNGDSYTEREALRQGNLLKQIHCLRRELNQLEKWPNGPTTYTYGDGQRVPLQLQVSKGAAITKLQSSLFVSEPLLVFRFKIMDAFELDPIWQTDAKCKLNDSITLSYVLSEDLEPYYKVQQRFFVKLLESLLQLAPQQVIFQNFPFLTHYAVSLLLFLSDLVYHSTEINNNCSLQTVSLTNLKKDGANQMRQLLQILCSDEHVHSVLDIKNLHKSPFSTALLQYNNNVLLACYGRMLGEQSFPMTTAKKWDEE